MNIQKLSRAHAVVLVGLAVLFSTARASAQCLQILHTNDLHEHFDEAEDLNLAEDPDAPRRGPGLKGGFAQLKAKIESLKAEAAIQGCESLVVDAGDFSEGTQYFLADRGEWSWRLMDQLGYDAVALGNHDFYVGQNELDRIVGNVQPRTPILSANFNHSKSLKNLSQHFKPYIELKRAGVKIAIIGLVTDSVVWKWRAGKNVIQNAQRTLDMYIDELSSRNDYVIVLSHLGRSADHKLVSFGVGVDLVVGGHSHNFLEKPDYELDMFNKSIPIVQAGQHGEVIGRLMVDVKKGKPMEMMKDGYSLIEIENTGPKDGTIAQWIDRAKQRLNDQYGEKWLHEVIGHSEINWVVPRKKTTPWGFFVNEAMKRAVQADVAIEDVGGAIYGDNLPAGPVTREKLFRSYARVFDANARYGYTIWTVDARGWALKAAIKQIMDQGFEIKPRGMTFDAKRYWKYGYHISNLRLNGNKVGNFEMVKIAMPEGIVRAIKEASPFKFAQILLHNPRDTGVPVWFALEDELNRQGGVIRASNNLK
jgi:2',3'-cyclic-nucleotide 2'-phosphodiesterase (5'-nucleotidase family)